MYIQKLILTPMSKGYYKIVRYNPEPEIASTLINERLSMGNPDNRSPRILKKLPKSLKNWVNLKCLVTK